MGNESGTWIMYGVDEHDPECLHSVDEAVAYINRVGFLPLFKNDIPGFSLEERTVPHFWWSGDAQRDPWEWRAIIARSGRVAYGKFFDHKAGFISLEWLPFFVNVRRDGYDFDALWDDEKAALKQKHVMDLFMGENEGAELFSPEIKARAGFGRDGDKGFEGVLSALQSEMYLCVRDFRQRQNRKGESYGWAIAVYATPEHMWGRELVTEAYKETPAGSAARIAEHFREVYPIVTEKQLKKVLGVKT